MKRAYKLEIKPIDRQREQLIRTFGVCRYVYNMYIGTNITAYKEGRKFMSDYDFSKWLNNVHTKQNQRDLWIKTILCEVPEYNKQTPKSEGIGMDLGIKEFAIMSNGKVYENINKTDKVRKLEKRLKQAQRKLSRSYEQNKKVGENCYFKNRQKQICRVQKLHQRLANIRENYQKHIVNDLVKTKLAFITLEDLNAAMNLKQATQYELLVSV